MRRICLTLFVLGPSAIGWFGIPAQAGVDIVINQRSQSMSVSVDGAVLYHWPVSTGRKGYTTPSGNFRVTRTERVYFSKKYDNAPMPNAIFFTNNGHAIHGTYETKRLGSAASHGCVRLAPSNAATLFRLVKAEGIGNTKVAVVGSAPANKTLSTKRQVQPRLEPEWKPYDPLYQYWDEPYYYDSW
jgi:hypothetical protein